MTNIKKFKTKLVELGFKEIEPDVFRTDCFEYPFENSKAKLYFKVDFSTAFIVRRVYLEYNDIVVSKSLMRCGYRYLRYWRVILNNDIIPALEKKDEYFKLLKRTLKKEKENKRRDRILDELSKTLEIENFINYVLYDGLNCELKIDYKLKMVVYMRDIKLDASEKYDILEYKPFVNKLKDLVKNVSELKELALQFQLLKKDL